MNNTHQNYSMLHTAINRTPARFSLLWLFDAKLIFSGLIYWYNGAYGYLTSQCLS